MITWESNAAIYNLFTCDFNFPIWHQQLRCQCDVVINAKNFHEILRCLLQVLGTPLNFRKLIKKVFYLEFCPQLENLKGFLKSKWSVNGVAFWWNQIFSPHIWHFDEIRFSHHIYGMLMKSDFLTTCIACWWNQIFSPHIWHFW